MQIELLNEQGQASAKYDAPETLFGRDYNEDLVHQVVVAYQANARQGTRAQKDRQAVKHSTKKPFKQKGTGRARHGSRDATQFVGGGRPKGPTPHKYIKAMPRKMRQQAIRCALTALLRAIVAEL